MQQEAVYGQLGTEPRRKGAETLHLHVTYCIQDQRDGSTFKSGSTYDIIKQISAQLPVKEYPYPYPPSFQRSTYK